eukprot:2049245-Prymnesium_polylepis.1
MGLRRLATANGASPNDIYEAFHRTSPLGLEPHAYWALFAQFDHDESGMIDFHEFEAMIIEWLQLPMPPRRLRELWQMLDQDGSGCVDYQEFSALQASTSCSDERNASGRVDARVLCRLRRAVMRIFPDLEVDMAMAAKISARGSFSFHDTDIMNEDEEREAEKRQEMKRRASSAASLQRTHETLSLQMSNLSTQFESVRQFLQETSTCITPLETSTVSNAH